jgi:hypothetical protein
MPGGLIMLRHAGAVLLLVLVGCGSSEPTDEQRVEAALLRLSDLPADDGWEIEPTVTDDPVQADLDSALDECEQELDPTVETRSAERDSDSFVRGEFLQAGSNASVVVDGNVRDELFDALEPLVDCFGTALEEFLIAQTGGDLPVQVSDPYSLDVSTAAERTEGHAIQLRVDPDTIFIDVVTIEQGPTLMYASFVHQGELTVDDEAEILAPAVERLKEL